MACARINIPFVSVINVRKQPYLLVKARFVKTEILIRSNKTKRQANFDTCVVV